MGTVAGGPSSRGGTRGGTRAGGIREGKGERGGRRTGPCSAQRPTRPLAPLPRRRSDSPVPFPRRPTTPAGAPLPPRQPLSEAPGPHSSPAGLQLTPTAPNTPRKDARRGGGGSLPEGQASRAARRPLCLPALPVRNAESGQRGRRGRARGPRGLGRPGRLSFRVAAATKSASRTASEAPRLTMLPLTYFMKTSLSRNDAPLC